MDELTRESIIIEPLLTGSDGYDFKGIENIPDSMLDIMLNGPTTMSIKKSEFRGLARQLYENLQRHENRTEPENMPLTLEQLRQMGGEPVWIHWIGHLSDRCDCWKIVNLNNPQGTLWDLMDYEHSWLAYKTKPEQEEK